MTTKRLLTLLLLVMAVSVALARSRQHAGDAPGTRSYAVTGVVTAPPADGRVMVAHDDIDGFMPAMTMPFTLRPADPVPAKTARVQNDEIQPATGSCSMPSWRSSHG